MSGAVLSAKPDCLGNAKRGLRSAIECESVCGGLALRQRRKGDMEFNCPAEEHGRRHGHAPCGGRAPCASHGERGSDGPHPRIVAIRSGCAEKILRLCRFASSNGKRLFYIVTIRWRNWPKQPPNGIRMVTSYAESRDRWRWLHPKPDSFRSQRLPGATDSVALGHAPRLSRKVRGLAQRAPAEWRRCPRRFVSELERGRQAVSGFAA